MRNMTFIFYFKKSELTFIFEIKNYCLVLSSFLLISMNLNEIFSIEIRKIAHFWRKLASFLQNLISFTYLAYCNPILPLTFKRSGFWILEVNFCSVPTTPYVRGGQLPSKMGSLSLYNPFGYYYLKLLPF